MSAWQAGARNLISDVPGISVGHADDDALRSGVTAVIFDRPAVASVAILGGAPGTRETALLEPENTVRAIDALVLSGGSAFGLDAGAGVMALLAEQGRGFEAAGARVPIVPAAILFDLANGGNKAWGRFPPYRDMGYAAAASALPDFAIGSVGAGAGCTTATVRGGLGSASTVLASGVTVAALVAVNAVGSPLVGSTRHFWAAPFEIAGEFGGLGLPSPWPADGADMRTKLDARPGGNTTIGIVATDARLDKAGARRLAVAAHDGFARALWPAHTDLDGDLVFCVATGGSDGVLDPRQRAELGAAAAATMARAIARGIFAATSARADTMRSWRDL